jgi:hypothetical protein
MWLPIESAPKDETDVLLFRVWSLRTSLPPIVAAWFDNAGGAGWCSHEKPDDFIEGNPTHGMPLPPPPEAGTVNEGEKK